jgi:hypothetical protein
MAYNICESGSLSHSWLGRACMYRILDPNIGIDSMEQDKEMN